MEGVPLGREAVDTYLGAVDWFRGILGRSEIQAAWKQPSAVADYTVGGLAAHAVHGVVWLEQLLKDEEPVGLRPVVLSEFFGPNRVQGPVDTDPFAGSLRTAAEAFAATGPGLVSAACMAARDDLVALLSEAAASREVPVIRVPGGQVSLREYLRTRVLEVIVHGDDVVCSVDGLQAPPPPAEALDVSLAVCIEMSRARLGDLSMLRAFTRAERADPDALRVL
jgi:hypothetical protein